MHSASNIKTIIYKTMRGFGLLNVTIALTIVAGLATYLIPTPEPTTVVKKSGEALDKADKMLLRFLTSNRRLPCPDVNDDGVEDCAATNMKGTLPYKTLGMSTAGFELGDAQIAYGVYRKANTTAVTNGGIDRVESGTGRVSILSNDADLATRQNRYQPTMSGGFTFDFPKDKAGFDANTDASVNGLDFCQALKVSEAATLDENKVHTINVANEKKNVAYAIAMGGGYNADGNADGNLLDGINASSTIAFNSPGTLLTSTYDDYVIARSFRDLQDFMECKMITQSMNMMANSVLVQKEVQDQAEDMRDAAVEGAIIAGITIAVIAYDVVLAAVDLANAIQTTSVASGLLSGAVASCAVLVGCAFIPVYTASVVAGGIGIGLSGVAVGAGVAAGVSQAVATGLYADVAVRAGASIPTSFDSPNNDGSTSTVNISAKVDFTDQINQLTAELNGPRDKVRTDANGDIVYKTDADGNFIVDPETGVRETLIDTGQPGLIDDAIAARADADQAETDYNNALNTANARFTTIYDQAVLYNKDNANNPFDSGNKNTDLDTAIDNYKTAIDNEYLAGVAYENAWNDYEAAKQNFEDNANEITATQNEITVKAINCSITPPNELCTKLTDLEKLRDEDSPAVTATFFDPETGEDVEQEVAAATTALVTVRDDALTNKNTKEDEFNDAKTASDNAYLSLESAVKTHPVYEDDFSYIVNWAENTSDNSQVPNCEARTSTLNNTGQWLTCENTSGQSYSVVYTNLLSSFITANASSINGCPTNNFSISYSPTNRVNCNLYELDPLNKAAGIDAYVTDTADPPNVISTIGYHAYVPQFDDNGNVTNPLKVEENSYLDALLVKQKVWKNLEKIAEEKERQVAETQDQLAKMQCLQTDADGDGRSDNKWDETTTPPSCVAADSLPNSSATQTDNGGLQILESADSKGVFQ